jgi:hypothetical protein
VRSRTYVLSFSLEILAKIPTVVIVQAICFVAIIALLLSRPQVLQDQPHLDSMTVP